MSVSRLGFLSLLLCLSGISMGMAGESTEVRVSRDEREIVDLTNKEREKAGLQPLAINPKLIVAARLHSANMAKQKLLAHELDGKGPPDRVKEQGYQYFEVGENIAWNDPTPKAAVEAWMNSPPHRENILNKNFTEIGVGIATDNENQPYYTQDFGRPQSAGPVAKATFTIKNESAQALTVKLPGSDTASVLPPGAQGTYTVSGMGRFPPGEVKAGESTQKIEIKDGAAYLFRLNEKGVLVSTDQTPQ